MVYNLFGIAQVGAKFIKRHPNVSNYYKKDKVDSKSFKMEEIDFGPLVKNKIKWSKIRFTYQDLGHHLKNKIK